MPLRRLFYINFQSKESILPSSHQREGIEMEPRSPPVYKFETFPNDKSHAEKPSTKKTTTTRAQSFLTN